MTAVELPTYYRPRNCYYKKCQIGLDLPSSFIEGLRQIDSGLYPVWHNYKVLWDTVNNYYYGSLEDPRNTISYEYGHLNFGYVLKTNTDAPLEDGTWHIWRLSHEAPGWCHIIELKSTEGEYLNLVLKRLKLQAEYTNKYGFKAYNKLLDSMREEDKERLQKDREEMFNCIQEENKWLMRRVADNFASGNTAPTSPKREIITSFSGQSNKSKIVRPITDKEANIWTPYDSD